MRLGCLTLVLAFGWASHADASIRIANWNLFNRPNSPADESALSLVFNAMSAASSHGIIDGIDILALQETDTGNPNSYARTLDLLNATGVGTFLATPVSNASGGGDRTGILYDSSELDLVDSTSIGGLVNPATRARFRPLGSDGPFDFWVYSVHLTASSPTARAAEMSILRADADALGPDAPVLWVGDFNLATSREAAWSGIEAPGHAQGRDVANTPGDFSGNPAFLHLHTQDPRSDMSDRFDFQFASTELFDGIGLDYIDQTHTVFGNNGTHSLGASITTGTGATVDVLAALASLSDHLPVMADYRIIIPEPTTTLLVGAIALTLTRRR